MSNSLDCHVFRTALDWTEFSFRYDVSTNAWQQFARAVETKEHPLLLLTKKGKVLAEFPLICQRVHAGCIQFEDAEKNIRIYLWRPSQRASAFGNRPKLEVEVHGELLSRSKSSARLLKQIQRGVEALFYGDLGHTNKERRKLLQSHVFPGRFDVAVDVNVRGRQADRWIENVLFGGGNRDVAADPWPTRIQKYATVFGCEETGRTFRSQRPSMTLSLYERDKHLRENKPAALAIHEGLLRSLGWDGKGRWLRVEWQVRPVWFNDQLIPLPDKEPKCGSRLTFREFLMSLPSITRTLWQRSRHMEPGSKGKNYDRPTSKFWEEMERCVELIAQDTSGHEAQDVVSEQRMGSATRQREKASTSVLKLMAVGGAKGAPMTLDGVLNWLRTDVNSQLGERQTRLVMNQWRRRFGASQLEAEDELAVWSPCETYEVDDRSSARADDLESSGSTGVEVASSDDKDSVAKVCDAGESLEALGVEDAMSVKAEK